MKSLVTLSISDLHSTFREPLFKVLLFFPFLAFAIIRWGYPILLNLYPPVEPYSEVILMWACLQSATMFGFIYGFIFLEEKEESIWQAVQVLPISGFMLVASRLVIGVLISTLVNFTILHYGGIIQLQVWKEFVIAIHFSLAAPLIALYIAAFARNKIEGLAQVKVINILVLLPAIIYFLPYKATFVTAVIPTFWSFRSLEFADSLKEFAIFLLVGLVCYSIAWIFLVKKMKRYQ